VLAVQEWATQCHGADTSLTAQRSTLAGMDPPRELVEQHRGVIPRRVRVVVRPCGVRALDAHTREWEQVCASALERGGPRPRGCFAVLPWWAKLRKSLKIGSSAKQEHCLKAFLISSLAGSSFSASVNELTAPS
jgi:hypothetical protein